LHFFKHKKKMILAILIVLLFVSIFSAFFYFYLETYGKVEFKFPNFPTSSVVIAAVGDCSGYNIVKYQEESSDPLASVRSLIEQSDIFLFTFYLNCVIECAAFFLSNFQDRIEHVKNSITEGNVSQKPA